MPPRSTENVHILALTKARNLSQTFHIPVPAAKRCSIRSSGLAYATWVSKGYLLRFNLTVKNFQFLDSINGPSTPIGTKDISRVGNQSPWCLATFGSKAPR